ADYATAADENALRVNQIDAASRIQIAEQRRTRVARHAIERGARAIVDADGIAFADRKARPVDHAATGIWLGDGKRVALNRDRSRPGDIVPALWKDARTEGRVSE